MEFKLWFENKDVTESAEFKKWFAGSILHDENRNPIPVYHGTQSHPFDKFSKEITTTGRHDPNAARGVISFTFSLDYASTRYAGLRKNQKRDIDKDRTKDTLSHFPYGRTIEAYLKITNPFDYRKKEHFDIIIACWKKNTEEWARTKARFLDPNEERGRELGVTPENRETKIKEYVDEEIGKAIKHISQGNYAYLEDPPFLRRHGFDSVFTFEFEQLHIHVLDVDQIWIVKQSYNSDFV